MGVVYRATDSRLHRDVALKFIPEAMAKDPQIMGRFEREAQVLASLNHPNIASIYGLEENAGQRALVMELASGEELATRIARGKLPLEEALRIALAIAEALEAAHDKGIIHRDLKPANIKLGDPGDSGGGRLKILDFGLAKALQGELGSASGIDLTRSPTLSVAATQAGMILGTASYMSPEQARALTADRRADIWSFGVILYEMLAGRRAFSGDTVADTRGEGDRARARLVAAAGVDAARDQEPDRALPGQEPAPAAAGDRRRAAGARGERSRICSGRCRRTLPRSAPAPVTTERATRPSDCVARGRARGCSPPPRWRGPSLRIFDLGPERRLESPLAVEIVVGTDDLYNGLGASFALSPDGNKLALRRERRQPERRSSFDGSTSSRRPSSRSTRCDRTGPIIRSSLPTAPGSATRCPTSCARCRLGGGAPLVDLQGHTQPRRHLARRRHHRAHSGSCKRPLPRARSGGEPQPLTTLDEKRERGHPPLAAGAPRRQARPLHLARQASRTSIPPPWRWSRSRRGERKVVYQGGSYGRYAPTGHLAVHQSRNPVRDPVRPRLARDSSGRAGARAPEGRDQPQRRRCAIRLLRHRPSRLRLPGPPRPSSIPSSGSIVTAVRARCSRSPGSTPTRASRPTARVSSLTVLRDENWDIWVYDLGRGVSTRLTFDEGRRERADLVARRAAPDLQLGQRGPGRALSQARRRLGREPNASPSRDSRNGRHRGRATGGTSHSSSPRPSTTSAPSISRPAKRNRS